MELELWVRLIFLISYQLLRQIYEKNVYNFINNLYDKEKKQIIINKEDEIIEKTLIK